jgi:opacity protein-like surface antigen
MSYWLKITIIVLGLSSVSFSQSFGLHGIGPKVSYLIPWGDELGNGFGVGAVIELGEIAPGLHFRPIFAYEKPGTANDNEGTNFTNFQLGADLDYFMYDNFYIGAGISVNFFSSSTDFDELFGNPESNSTKFGFSLIGGYWTDLGSGVYLGSEFRGDIISDYNHMEVALILMFPIGK